MSVLPSREPKAVAQRAVREAATISAFVVALRFFFATSLLVSPLPGTSRWLSVLGFLDCGLLAGLAYAVYRMSRIGTVLLLAYFVADQFLKAYFQVFNRGGVGVLILVLGCIFLSMRAIFACFRYHSLLGREQLECSFAEPDASPNGGPAERLGNSGVGGGPPSVT